MTPITIQTKIPVPLDAAWNYYTDPQHITQWNFASEEWHCPSATNDLRVGGVYQARMEAKDGSMGFDFKAIYDSVQIPVALSYTLEDGRKIKTTFEEIDNQTVVITVFDPEKSNPIEVQRHGWQAILDNYAQYSANMYQSD